MNLRSFSTGHVALLALLAVGCESLGEQAPALARGEKLSSPEAANAASVPVVESSEVPLVDLHGQTRDWITAAGVKRLYARSNRVWIRKKPSRGSNKLGYLRAGAAAAITGAPQLGDGCRGDWYPIAPSGFVCEGRSATFDATDPVVAAMSEYAPDHTRRLPYVYGTVRKPGPVYGRLPTPEEMRTSEVGIDRRMDLWFEIGGEIGSTFAQHVWLGADGEAPDPKIAWAEQRTEPLPSFLRAGGAVPNFRRKPRDKNQLVLRRMRPKVGHSFVETFFWRGRRYGLSAEMELLPTDRLRPIQGSSFSGLEIDESVRFPFAMVRQIRGKYHDGSRALYRGVLQLPGKKRFYSKVLHYETTDGKWVSDRVASKFDSAKKMPGWALRGERWIDISISRQALILYEGETPVYATLVSTGEAGLGDASSTTATKRGIFRIHTKHVSTTMSSSEVGEAFELRDVPYVQYFDKQGYAIHGAYWHDRFGMPKSHGCINLAPEDARRVFHWTSPQVPDHWHGALSALKGTVVFIHP